MTDFTGDDGVDNMRVSGTVTASTSISLYPVQGYPDDNVLHLGFYHPPVLAIHAEDEQLVRLRDAIDEYLARRGGASDV